MEEDSFRSLLSVFLAAGRRWTATVGPVHDIGHRLQALLMLNYPCCGACHSNAQGGQQMVGSGFGITEQGSRGVPSPSPWALPGAAFFPQLRSGAEDVLWHNRPFTSPLSAPVLRGKTPCFSYVFCMTSRVGLPPLPIPLCKAFWDSSTFCVAKNLISSSMITHTYYLVSSSLWMTIHFPQLWNSGCSASLAVLLLVWDPILMSLT